MLLLGGAASCRTHPSRPPSLLLISIDTLRADHVHAYGYERNTTPFLDALAGRGARFAQAWAHTPWTLPSHATMLSGTVPFRNGVVDDATMLGPSLPLLAPLLRERGYATSGVVSGFYVSSRFGFQRGFERFEDFGLASEARPRDSVRAEEVAARAIEDLRAAGEKPFFLFAHFFDCHNDYAPPPPYDAAFDRDVSVVPYKNYESYKTAPLAEGALRHVIAQYDEEILYTDAMIGRLLEALEAAGRAEDTYVVVTADHGEELFEHGSWGHGHSLHTQVLHVPLIVAGPGVQGARVPRALVRHMDLAPTLLDLLGIATPPAMMGSSYAGLLRSDSPDASEASDSGRVLLADTSRFGSNAVGFVTARRALLVDLKAKSAQLFDLEADPDERNALGESRAREAGAYWQLLLDQVRTAATDRWIVAWSGRAAAHLRVDGVVLPAADRAAGDRIAFDALGSWSTSDPSGLERLTIIPPDAPVDFEVRCGSKKPCFAIGSADPEAAADESIVSKGPAGTLSRTAEVGSPIRGRDGTSIRISVDPIKIGERLRRIPASSDPKSTQAQGTPSVRVWIESRAPAPVPAELTPEEIERLNALGYVH